MRRNGTIKSVYALVLIMCLITGGFAGRAGAQEGDSVADGIMAAWSISESTATSAADGVRATAVAYGRSVAEHWYRLSTGQGQACDIRGLFASDSNSQAEAQYLYDLNTYWLKCSEAPTVDRSISAVFNPAVTDVQVSLDGQTAVASVTAGWTKHVHSDTTDNSMVCKLTMRLENRAWRIAHEDCPADQTRRYLFPMGTDFAELTRELPAQKAATRRYQSEEAAAWQRQVENMRDAGDPRYAFLPESDRQLAPLPAGVAQPLVGFTAYTGWQAAEYAFEYYLTYNSYFPSWKSSQTDCQNFACQCVWSGFGGSNSGIPSHSFPMIGAGTGWSEWWCDKNSGVAHASPSWTSGLSFETMGKGNFDNNSCGVQAYCGSAIGNDSSPGGAPISSACVGDLVRAHRNSPYLWHTMVIDRIDSHTLDGIYVSSHTNDIYDVKLSTICNNQIYLDFEHISIYRNP
jgi:hypothetical protein